MLIAVTSFVVLAVFHLAFPLVIAAAAGAGWLLERWWPTSTTVKEEADAGQPPLISDAELHHGTANLRRNLVIVLGGLVLWVAPIGAVALLFGRDSVFVDQGVFFAGTALVPFGGAYPVLAFVARAGRRRLSLARTRRDGARPRACRDAPGPHIMVVQFVAFLGANRDPGSVNPWAAAMIGALLTSWVTFVPCFLFAFLGAPFVERLRGNIHLSSAWPRRPCRDERAVSMAQIAVRILALHRTSRV